MNGVLLTASLLCCLLRAEGMHFEERYLWRQIKPHSSLIRLPLNSGQFQLRSAASPATRVEPQTTDWKPNSDFIRFGIILELRIAAEGVLGPGDDGFHHWVVVAMRRIIVRARLIFILVDPRVLRCLVGAGCYEVEVPLSMKAWCEPSPNRLHPAPTGIT